MTQEAILREKFKLLKATLKPRFHLMLEDLAKTCFKAIDESGDLQKDNYERFFGDILCGKDRYYRTDKMTKGVVYKISSSVESDMPEDAVFLEMSEAAWVEMKQKNNSK